MMVKKNEDLINKNINLSSKAIKKLMEDEPTLTVGQFKKRIGVV